MISPIATITLQIDLDIDEMKPNLDIDTRVEPTFASLTKQPQVFVDWLNRAIEEVRAQYLASSSEV